MNIWFTIFKEGSGIFYFNTLWLERPTGIVEGHGFDSRWGYQKIYFLSNST